MSFTKRTTRIHIRTITKPICFDFFVHFLNLFLHTQHVYVWPPFHSVRGIDSDQTFLVWNIARKEESAGGLAERIGGRQWVVVGFPHGQLHVFRNFDLFWLELDFWEWTSCQFVGDRQGDWERILSATAETRCSLSTFALAKALHVARVVHKHDVLLSVYHSSVWRIHWKPDSVENSILSFWRVFARRSSVVLQVTAWQTSQTHVWMPQFRVALVAIYSCRHIR